MTDSDRVNVLPKKYPYIPRTKGTVQALLGCVLFGVCALWCFDGATDPAQMGIITRLILGAIALLCGLITIFGLAVIIALPFADKNAKLEISETAITIPVTFFGTRYQTVRFDEITHIGETDQQAGHILWLYTPKKMDWIERRRLIVADYFENDADYADVRETICTLLEIPEDQIGLGTPLNAALADVDEYSALSSGT